MRMGRRARTNCSPIDSAMEKYHNDIGSRLSGVFVPPQPLMDNNSNSSNPTTTEALSMLTLDTRSKSHINHGNQQDTLLNATSATNSSHPHNTTDSSSSITCHCPTSTQKKTEKSQTLPISLAQSPAMSACQKTMESTHSCGAEDKEKRRLVDKITRALFQRKHTCSRCQRKSRSCLPNKTFNSSEKHYTCGSCRETSHAMKSLLSGQNVNNNNNNNNINDANSDKDSNNLPVPFIGIRIASRDDVILPKPRTHIKDSGYETVTSCSTVASSHSHNSAVTTNGSTKNQTQTDINNTSRLEDFTTNQRSYNNTNCNNGAGTPYCEHSSSVQRHDARVNPTAGLEQYMGVVTSDNTNVRVLKQVKTRYVENYDGYLPNAQVNQDTCVVKRPALPVFADNTIASPSAEGVDPAWNRSNTYATGTGIPIDNTNNNMCTYGSTAAQECHGVHYTETKNTKQGVKVCYTCGSSTKPCFHLPWEGGWLCEDCLDGVF